MCSFLIKGIYIFIKHFYEKHLEIRLENCIHWIPHCREVVNVIYGLCSRPYAVISYLFGHIMKTVKEILYHHNLLYCEMEKTKKRLEELKSIVNLQQKVTLFSFFK